MEQTALAYQEPSTEIVLPTEILKIRTGVYDLFRRFFYEEPSKAYLRACKENDVFVAFPFQGLSSLIDEGIDRIEVYNLTNNPLENEEDYRALHWDFTRMFIGPATPAAPPWASYYLENDRMLFQQTTLAVRCFLQKYGYIAGEHLNGQADDHVGIELDFMYQLSSMLADTNGTSEDTDQLLLDQIAFVSQQLMPFIPAFRETVTHASETGFYAGLACLLQGFLEEDLAFLKTLVKNEKEVVNVSF